MQVDSGSLQKKVLGALPIVHHYLHQLDWPQLLQPQIRHPHYIQALDLLVKSVLLKPAALYRVGAWSEQHAPACRPSQYVSDDTLARALDRLFEADRASLLTEVILRAIRVFQIDTSQIHNDSTSVKLCGAYEHQNPKGLKLCRGFSKDYRPDLKQLIFSLSISADGAVPIHYKTYAGNQVDSPTHWDTWQALRQLTGKADFLYVADGKLCVTETMQNINAQGGRFITVLPRLRCEAAEFANQAAAGDVQWTPLWTRRALRGKRRENFELAQGDYRLKEGGHLHWYRSSEKRAHDAQMRTERIDKALRFLRGLNERRGRGPKTEPAIRRSAERLLAKYHIGSCVRFQVKLVTRYARRQSTRGHPTADTKCWKERITTPVVSVQRNSPAIKQAATMDGVFPLVTNTDLSALEVMKKYKYQPRLEKRHCLAKSVLEISPVFLKKNTRIEALMFIYFVAELIAALMERSTRKNMIARNLRTLPILPEGRPSQAPSYRQIIESFESCEILELHEPSRSPKIFRTPLTDLQKLLLSLLEVPAAVYQ